MVGAASAMEVQGLCYDVVLWRCSVSPVQLCWAAPSGHQAQGRRCIQSWFRWMLRACPILGVLSAAPNRLYASEHLWECMRPLSVRGCMRVGDPLLRAMHAPVPRFPERLPEPPAGPQLHLSGGRAARGRGACRLGRRVCSAGAAAAAGRPRGVAAARRAAAARGLRVAGPVPALRVVLCRGPFDPPRPLPCGGAPPSLCSVCMCSTCMCSTHTATFMHVCVLA